MYFIVGEESCVIYNKFIWLTDRDWKMEIVSKNNAAQWCHSLVKIYLLILDLLTMNFSNLRQYTEIVVTDNYI